MKRVKESLVTAALVLVMLSGCQEETLAFGEPRCQRVSCAPHELETKVERTLPGREYVGRDAVVEAATVPSPCPIEGTCRTLSPPAMRLLTRAGETSALVAAPFYGFRGEPEEFWREGTGLWVGRYQDGAWASSRFISTDGPVTNTNPSDRQVAIASDREAPGEALIAVTELQRAPHDAEHRLRVFRFDEHDELQLLFEDKQAAFLNDAVMLDDDLLVAGVLQGNLELTRYGMDGEIRWRQTELKSSMRFDSSLSHRMQIGVFDTDRIAVLLHNGPGHFELLVLDGSGEKLWSYPLATSSELGARLAADSSGALWAVTGGYAVERIEIGDGAERWSVTGRDRERYYELEIGGFDVGPSGWAYFATMDGDRFAPVELIERVAPDGSLIDSIEVDTGYEPVSGLAGLSRSDCQGLLGGGGTMRIDSSEQRAFLATSQCFAEIPLPPLPE